MIPSETVEENFKIPKQEIIEIMKDYFKKNKGLKFTMSPTNLNKVNSSEKTNFKARFDIKNKNSFTPEVTVIIDPIDTENTKISLEYQLFSHTQIFLMVFIIIAGLFWMFGLDSENLFTLSAHFPLLLIGFALILSNLGFQSDFEKLNNYFKKLFLTIRKEKHE